MNWYRKAQSDPKDQLVESLTSMMESVVPKTPKTFIPGSRYAHPDQFFLEHGQFFESQPLTPEEMAKVKKVSGSGKQFKMKECFYNAQKLSSISKFQYVEGYVLSGIPFAISHAWNVINGKVIDVTLAHRNGDKVIAGILPEGWAYFGVDFPVKEIMKIWLQHEMSQPIISWESSFEYLKRNFPEATDTDQITPSEETKT